MRKWLARISVTSALMLMPISVINASQGVVHHEDYTRAKQAFERNDFATARKLFTKLARQGQVEAQTTLGMMYDKGLGGPQNYKKAVTLFRQAAEQKDPVAQYHLGVKYVNGHGVKENPMEAYIWFAISFNNGYELAADPLRILNQSLSTVDRQQALKVVVKKMEVLGK